jgi:squalene-hopene/tetraprenyl-beta-curcumene cyclase
MEHSAYGGFGYGSSQEPDMSNTQMAADALKALNLPPDDPAWEKLAVFVTRTIQDPEVNDLIKIKGLRADVGNDGGAIYKPDSSEAGKVTLEDGRTAWRSYGSMTYAAMKSLLFAGIPKDDLRIKSVLGWLNKNYSVGENPGMGQQGLYYYYTVMPKALNAAGVNTLKDPLGIEHLWRNELIQKVCSLQKEDGSWVNAEKRWWEDQPVLVTTYAVLTLIEARDVPK